MLERYSSEKMRQIWSEENKLAAWLEVELQVVEAWVKLGEIPAEDAALLREKCKVNRPRMLEIEKETRHDVVAFTRMLSEELGPEKKWIHYGLTSTDVVDTANGYLLRQANAQITEKLEKLIALVKELAVQYKYTICMGRTHGVHAEPTTFGLKLLGLYAELLRRQEQFLKSARAVETGKISGAVGTFANVPLFIEEEVCRSLGLQPQPISTQVLPRDLHAEYMSSMALVATTLERFAIEIRHLQRTEVREVEEGFKRGQKGSSAMPHKRNPISNENICGLSRVMRGYMTPAFEDVALWHERDISHSSVERIILPDATALLDYMLQRFYQVLDNLYVNEKRMKENVWSTQGLIFSQRVLLELIEVGMSREEAYDLVQPLAMKAWEEGLSFMELIQSNERVLETLGQEKVAQLFDLNYHLQNVDEIYARFNL